MRTVILGNAGSGKTTMARALAPDAVLSLDLVAFVDGTPERLPVAESAAAIERFVDGRASWAIEGCFGDLAALALAHADELAFLNPGIDVCVAHCRARPWEPDKFATRADQDAMLATLIEWVQEYEARDDEFGLTRHRAVFEAYRGRKRELTNPSSYRPKLA